MLHSICQQIWKTQQWPQDWKRSVFIPIPKKGNAKECSNYHTITLILHANKVMLKILQARLQQYVNWQLPDVQAGFRKSRGTRDQIANIHWTIEKAREFQKNFWDYFWIYFCFTDYTKAFDCVDHNKLQNPSRDGNTRPPYLPPEKTVCRSRSKLELDMEQQTGSKQGKEYIKAVYCHPVYLTYMQSTSCEMPGWMKHKLESRLPGQISITSDMQMTPPLWKKVKRISLLMKVKEDSEKASLKLNVQKTKIIAFSSMSSWETDVETMETVTDLLSWAPKSLQMVIAATKLKDACSLEEKLRQN